MYYLATRILAAHISRNMPYLISWEDDTIRIKNYKRNVLYILGHLGNSLRENFEQAKQILTSKNDILKEKAADNEFLLYWIGPWENENALANYLKQIDWLAKNWSYPQSHLYNMLYFGFCFRTDDEADDTCQYYSDLLVTEENNHV